MFYVKLLLPYVYYLSNVGGAIVGGLIGAVDANSGDEVGGLIAGALIGGLLGSAEDNSAVQTQRDQIVFQCLRGRGHSVVG